MKIGAAILSLVLFTYALVPPPLCAADDASVDFQSIIARLRSMRSSRSTSTYQFVDTAERLLLGFLDKYPGTYEAARAQLVIGQIYSGIGKHKEAIKHIGEYFKADFERDPAEEERGRFVIASSNLALENFDEAERLFLDLVESRNQIDRRLINQASMELARIGTLRRLTIGSPAIAFSAVTSEGKKIKLGDYKGKVVLLDFWASWCKPCTAEMPNVKQVYGEFHDKGFEIIGISLDRDESQFRRYIGEEKLPWTQIFGGKGGENDISRMYAVVAIPSTFLLDRQGRIQRKNLRGEELRTAVSELIKNK